MIRAALHKLKAQPAKRLALLGAVIVSAIAVSTAFATEDYDFPPTTAGVSATASPATVKMPHGWTPTAINFTTTLTANPASRIPATVDSVAVYISRAAKLNGRLFPSCDAHKLDLVQGRNQGYKICPRASKIGTLSTLGYYAQLREPIHADIYNTMNGKAFLFYFFGDNPVIIRVPVIGKLIPQPKSSIYAYKMEMHLPEQLQDPVPGTYASFRILRSHLFGVRTVKRGHKKVKRGYFETYVCPIGGQAPLKMEYHFLDGTSSTADSFARCAKK